MTEMTPLDLAHDAMDAAPEDDTARLRFFERLADSEMFVLLSRDPEGETLAPEVFETEEGQFVLVFDREDRLSAFADRAVPYAALSGRMIVQMLDGQGIGLGVNLEVAPSSILIPAEGIGWLAQTLAHEPGQVEAGIEELRAPTGLPEVLLTSLDQKLASAVGLAKMAYLVSVVYEGGGRGYLLGFIDVQKGAEEALAKAVGEALTFSGLEAGALDVGTFSSSSEVAAYLAKVGLRFDMPQPDAPKVYQPVPPGSDPDAPPKLR